jgi:hypothetical protein
VISGAIEGLTQFGLNKSIKKFNPRKELPFNQNLEKHNTFGGFKKPSTSNLKKVATVGFAAANIGINVSQNKKISTLQDQTLNQPQVITVQPSQSIYG